MDLIQMQKEFLYAFKMKQREFSNDPYDKDTFALWYGLISEEYAELLREFQEYVHENNFQTIKITAELADLIYVLIGFANAMNLPLKEFYEAIHKANMDKLGKDGKPILREDGKILKPEGWLPAPLKAIHNVWYFANANTKED